MESLRKLIRLILVEQKKKNLITEPDNTGEKKDKTEK